MISQLIEFKHGLYMDSRQVAEMVGKRHADLLREIDGFVDVLENAKLRSLDFFVKSSYRADGNKRTYPYYLLSKMGCEFIANKQTGGKGVLFTAAYVKLFNKMEQERFRHQLLRDVSKAVRKGLTDVIRDEIPESPHKKFVYKHYTDLIYKTVLGCSAKQFRKQHKLDKKANIKDFLSDEQLKKINTAEDIVKSLIKLNWSYEQISNFVKNQLALTA